MNNEALENDPIFSEVQLRSTNAQSPIVPTEETGAGPVTSISGGNSGFSFSPAPSSSMSSPLTTKGDIYVRTAAAGSRLPVGADGAWLVGDSAATTGLNWRSGATGWGTPSSTLARTTFATYAGQTISALYSQAEVQTIDDHVKVLSQRLGALITDLLSKAIIKA